MSGKKQIKYWEQKFATYVYYHYCNMCNIRFTFATSALNTCNIPLIHLKHLKHTLATCTFTAMLPCYLNEWRLVVVELDVGVEVTVAAHGARGGARGWRRHTELAAVRRSAAAH
jgi:hypothetical protein